MTVNLLILLLLFFETHILCLGEAFLGWGMMPSLKKGKKQGKSHFVAEGAAFYFFTYQIYFSLSFLKTAQTGVSVHTGGKSDPWEFPRISATDTAEISFCN